MFCNEQKNDRSCSGNYRSNVSECLFQLKSKRDRNTAIGAGAGALGGAVLTDGSTLGTIRCSRRWCYWYEVGEIIVNKCRLSTRNYNTLDSVQYEIANNTHSKIFESHGYIRGFYVSRLQVLPSSFRFKH